MYTSKMKKTAIFFIISLLMFCLCFTMHISANTTSSTPDESTSTSPVSSQESPASSETSSETVSENSGSSTVSGEEESLPESIPSETESSAVTVSSSLSSGEVDSITVETVSNGGAPDYTDENGEYVYTGSYAGINSNTTSSQPEKEEIKTTKQNATAQRYAKYAKLGMFGFGFLSLLAIFFLIYYNSKVRESKRIRPEWYPKKEKVTPKHGKH